MKHRCSQTQFKAVVTGCQDSECGSRGRNLVVPLSRLEMYMAFVMAHCQTNTECYFSFLLFFFSFHKSEYSLQIFWLANRGANVGLLQKWNAWSKICKTRDTCNYFSHYNSWNCQTLSCSVRVESVKNVNLWNPSFETQCYFLKR